ncbi:hypothetical protein DSM112329_00506 [Paraconexibacter sp. AEG42_29]|uniref:Lipoprotein n=1 Tax=Paraconexibacter sp. AEG42_29 TaxID=2997339 RepID=A0AAU7APX0_9ACTN
MAGGAIGCGSSDDGGTTNLDVLEQAASKTAKQQSFHMAMTMDQTVMGQAFSVVSEGDYSGGKGRMTLDFGSVAKLLGAVPGASDTLQQLGGANALKATMITDKTSILLKSDAMKKALKQYANKDVADWARLDVLKLGKTFGIDLSSIFAGSSGSEQTIAYMRALTGALDKIGAEKIAGVDTTHYRGTLDVANIPKGAVPPAMEKTFKQLGAALKKSGAPTKSPVDVWVGKDGLVRRQVVTQKFQGVSQKITINLSDYGKATKITVPPAAQQFDAIALADELAPGALGMVAQAMKSGGLAP